MALRNFSSTAAETTLAAGISSANTTIQVAATTGFPSVPFILALDAGAAAQELVLVTNVAGTTLTVTRGYDSTVASAHEVGATVAHSHGGIDFREANTHVNANSGVHGATGDVVGTTDTQTLTNKTLALGSNTVSGTKAQFNTAMTDADFLTSTDSFMGAWTPWTPTVTASSGTFTTVSGAGRWTQIGKVIHWQLTITITTAGTAAGYIMFPLPVAPQGTGYIGNGREDSATGVILEVFNILAETPAARVIRYDNATAIGSARTLLLSGTYEAA